MTIRVKEWDKFQHYKHRRPPWIRLYASLIQKRSFGELSGDAVKTLVQLWIIASEDETLTGKLPDVEELVYRLRIDSHVLASHLSELHQWLEYDAGDVPAQCQQHASAINSPSQCQQYASAINSPSQCQQYASNDEKQSSKQQVEYDARNMLAGCTQHAGGMHATCGRDATTETETEKREKKDLSLSDFGKLNLNVDVEQDKTSNSQSRVEQDKNTSATSKTNNEVGDDNNPFPVKLTPMQSDEEAIRFLPKEEDREIARLICNRWRECTGEMAVETVQGMKRYLLQIKGDRLQWFEDTIAKRSKGDPVLDRNGRNVLHTWLVTCAQNAIKWQTQKEQEEKSGYVDIDRLYPPFEENEDDIAEIKKLQEEYRKAQAPILKQAEENLRKKREAQEK